jgi:hypothetical protein
MTVVGSHRERHSVFTESRLQNTSCPLIGLGFYDLAAQQIPTESIRDC